MMSDAAKNFDILATYLNVLHNYFDSLLKLFSDLYLTKFLNTSAKLFLPCKDYYFMSPQKISKNIRNYNYHCKFIR